MRRPVRNVLMFIGSTRVGPEVIDARETKLNEHLCNAFIFGLLAARNPPVIDQQGHKSPHCWFQLSPHQGPSQAL
jgi:hypothetical protein